MRNKIKKGINGRVEKQVLLSDIDLKKLISRTIKGEDELIVLEEIIGKRKFTKEQIKRKLWHIKRTQRYRDNFNELKIATEKNIKKDLTWTIERATESLLVVVEAAKTIIAEDLEIRFETETSTEVDKITGEKKQVLVWKKDPDGKNINKRRRLSSAATMALTEAVRELNKVHKLTSENNQIFDNKPVYFEGEVDLRD